MFMQAYVLFRCNIFLSISMCLVTQLPSDPSMLITAYFVVILSADYVEIVVIYIVHCYIV